MAPHCPHLLAKTLMDDKCSSRDSLGYEIRRGAKDEEEEGGPQEAGGDREERGGWCQRRGKFKLSRVITDTKLGFLTNYSSCAPPKKCKRNSGVSVPLQMRPLFWPPNALFALFVSNKHGATNLDPNSGTKMVGDKRLERGKFHWRNCTRQRRLHLWLPSRAQFYGLRMPVCHLLFLLYGE